ncbi:hypothetical protein [Pyrobaculum sp.]
MACGGEAVGEFGKVAAPAEGEGARSGECTAAIEDRWLMIRARWAA